MELTPEALQKLFSEDANAALEQFKAFYEAQTKAVQEKDSKIAALSAKEQEAAKLSEERAELAAKLKSFEAVGDPAQAIEAIQQFSKYKELGDPEQLKRIRDEYTKLSDTFKAQAELFGKSLEEKTQRVQETEQKASQMSAEMQALLDQNKKLEKQYEKLAHEFSSAQKRAKEATINSALSNTFSKLEIQSNLRRAAEAIWKPAMDLNDAGEPIVKQGDQVVSLEEALKAWTETDEGKAFVKAPQSSGEVSPAGVDAKTKATPEDQYKNPDGTLNWTKLSQGLTSGDETAARLMKTTSLN